eukprot:TRINITY_DN79932_c0_g1_i1.p1 TRINITY_DN79932_c0_g1~~TRINITY_DN79932_c0_g1_i1.p1  ORF type:complete len:439 (-),score=97.65 TRINITY_DN79932_c0_g1_i1:13-1266(-)
MDGSDELHAAALGDLSSVDLALANELRADAEADVAVQEQPTSREETNWSICRSYRSPAREPTSQEKVSEAVMEFIHQEVKHAVAVEMNHIRADALQAVHTLQTCSESIQAAFKSERQHWEQARQGHCSWAQSSRSMSRSRSRQADDEIGSPSPEGWCKKHGSLQEFFKDGMETSFELQREEFDMWSSAEYELDEVEAESLKDISSALQKEAAQARRNLDRKISEKLREVTEECHVLAEVCLCDEGWRELTSSEALQTDVAAFKASRRMASSSSSPLPIKAMPVLFATSRHSSRTCERTALAVERLQELLLQTVTAAELESKARQEFELCLTGQLDDMRREVRGMMCRLLRSLEGHASVLHKNVLDFKLGMAGAEQEGKARSEGGLIKDFLGPITGIGCAAAVGSALDLTRSCGHARP